MNLVITCSLNKRAESKNSAQPKSFLQPSRSEFSYRRRKKISALTDGIEGFGIEKWSVWRV